MRQLLITVLICASAFAQNWTDGKVEAVVPLVAYGTGIIQLNTSICMGRLSNDHRLFSLSVHPAGEINWGTYRGRWLSGPSLYKHFLSDGTWVTGVTGELLGTFEFPSGETLSNVHAWFSETIDDTKYGKNTAFGCGLVDIIFRPNG